MLFQDIRYALRNLWQNKAFTVVAMLCLGFGIGLNTAIFSIVDGVLLKPLPYEDPDRILVLNSRNLEQDVDESGLSFLDLRDLGEATRTLGAVAASRGRSLTISDGGEPERFSGSAISAGMFPLLGVAPVLGRGFNSQDDQAGAASVALLSHALWSLRYQEDRSVVGRTILVNGVPTTVIGVMPPDFEFPQNQKLWIPLTPLAAGDPRDARALFTFGRMAPGTSQVAVAAELAAVGGQLATEFPATNQGWDLYPRTLREEFIPEDVSLIIVLMMAAVTLVLFIACSNVANLQLARASARQREISLRAALGAGRRRIVMQLLTENIVLALVSVPLGVLLGVVGSRAIFSAMPVEQVPYYIRWSVDARTLLYSFGVAAVTAVLFGLLPALQASGGNLVESLKEGTRGNSVRRSLLRSGLVVVQVALALVSLVSALLFVRSFANLDAYDVGYDTTRLMAMRFYLPGEAYQPEGAKARRVQDIVDRVERLAGVEAAFSSNLVPLSGGGNGGRVVVDGRPAEPGKEPGINFYGVTPRFLETLGVAVRGRTFTTFEGTTKSSVALINQTMADDLWPGADAIGGRFRMTWENPTWFTVIGILPNVQLSEVDPDVEPERSAFVSYPHQETENTGLVVRTTGDPAAIASAAREAIRSADPNLPVFAVSTMERLRQLGFWQFQIFGGVFATIGIVGLLLAAVGVYGVLSYAVNQRTAEIGVRVALGASRGQILRLVVGHGVTLSAVGIGAGLGLALFAMPLAQQFFYNVSPFDPVTFVSVSVFLAVVAALASFVPARRATRVDPIVALRGD